MTDIQPDQERDRNPNPVDPQPDQGGQPGGQPRPDEDDDRQPGQAETGPATGGEGAAGAGGPDGFGTGR